MCGIVGYIGKEQAAPILLDGLARLEYRGYDSAGVAIYNGEEIKVVKAKGRLKVLSEMTHDGASLPGTIGIGHTRWATHGAPSDTNAHPHFNQDESIVVVHNGIIENYQKLKKKLEGLGFTISRGLMILRRRKISLSARQIMSGLRFWMRMSISWKKRGKSFCPC